MKSTRLRRDREVASRLAHQAEIAVRRFHDRVIVPPREIATKEGKFYSVFTPYRRVWDTKALDFVETLPQARKQTESLRLKPSKIPSRKFNWFSICQRSPPARPLWKPGEREAQARLQKFASRELPDYDDARDIPSQERNELSCRLPGRRRDFAATVSAAALLADEKDLAAQWRDDLDFELTWRDFYTHVMVGLPRVSKHQPFK